MKTGIGDTGSGSGPDTGGGRFSGINWGFYGWRMLPFAWLIYGLGAAPFYSWGYFAAGMNAELGLTRADSGLAFGVWTFFGGAVAPLIGVCLTRFGLRPVFTLGFFVVAGAYYLTSRAQDRWDVLLYFGLFAGLTHTFTTVLPTQTLATNWFLRWRASALAFLLTAAGLMGPLILRFDALLLGRGGTWRDGWGLIAVLCCVLGALSFLAIRNRPESVGQLRDGARTLTELEATAPRSEPAGGDHWTAVEALRTPQFALMVVCGLGYAVPWGVVNAHGGLHLRDLGFGDAPVAALLGLMILCSTGGRIAGALGDLVRPPRLLGFALAMEGAGMALFLLAGSAWTARVALVLLGLGFGMAYISQAATFASFFGRRAFATTTGTRFAIGAPFGALVPFLAGLAFDTWGSYAVPFLAIATVTLTGSVVAFFLQPPRKKQDVAGQSR